MEFPQHQKPPGDGKIIYPPGVKEITDKISNDEVVKRLKVRTLSCSSSCQICIGVSFACTRTHKLDLFIIKGSAGEARIQSRHLDPEV